ncbi:MULTISPECIES: multidrug effflux MFS transporter [Rhodopirellula]|uniref:Drug resistance transporter, Bcr/CflA subfamily protein n=1 Tax=Rhodopirellula europaea 6C TaxID=1263867 RepID=M2A6P5_9BACT|nr:MULTISPECIES: multidrug effflux MFS transporter [Rhodopirellula]EMB16551.1 drug resistance transporter, Bcr/CflA subfamily protein [Rhodopirellula europaea 6C]
MDLKQKPALPLGEFVTLMALMIALVALAIDAMLPALPIIGEELGATHENDSQLIVSLLFLGMALGQLFFGPLSDSIGRKSALSAGLGLFVVGSMISLFAETFTLVLVGRFVQGLGVAGPRSVSLALIRDQYEGRAMARVMSFVMTIFILVPVIAPTLGQAILMVANWRAIFAVLAVMALMLFGWFALRQPETLLPAHRMPFSLQRILLVSREVCTNRIAFGYTLVAGLVSGAFLGFLSSAAQIFQQQYDLGSWFPIYFAVLASAAGVASLMNANLVMRFGMRALIGRAMLSLAVTSVGFLGFAFLYAGSPPLWSTMAYLLAIFFAIGILFGNLNSLAMEPLGHVAGIGSALVGSISTLISVPLGILIGHSYNGTILPLIGGFAVLGALSLLVMRWVESAAVQPCTTVS